MYLGGAYPVRRSEKVSLTILILIIISPTAQTQPTATIEAFDFCRAYEQYSVTLMNVVNCSVSKIEISSCTDNTFQTFNGRCACGDFDVGSNRLIELVIDSGIKSRIPNLLVYKASDSVDVRASYTSICETFFSTINCPSAWQIFQGCAAKMSTDLFMNNASCVCGSMDVASDRIKELMVDAIIAKHFSIPSTQGRINRNEMRWFLLFLCFLGHL